MRTAALLCLLALSLAARSQSRGPQPTPMPPPIAAPQDRPFPGVIHLHVNATDLTHRIFSMHETIPVQSAGPLTLLYPEWIPGNHAPNNPLTELGGLTLEANGQRIPWTRDPVNVFAFHVTVPSGVTTITADFQWLTPVTPSVGRVTMTQAMLDLQWNAVALYPAGYFSRDVQIEPSLTLPDGWQMGTALEPASTSGATTTFKPVPFNTLLDSPVYAGRYFKRFDLDPNGPAKVSLDVVADRPDARDPRSPPRAGPAGIQTVWIAPLRSLRLSLFAE